MGKVALGTTHQVLDVTGSTTLSGTGVAPVLGVPAGVYPGAIFAQSSNLGQRVDDKFTIAPEIRVKLGCDITRHLRGTVGYDFLYWNNAVRPADQIDRNVNSAQTPLSPNFGNPINPVAPAALFNRTEFWAQGFTFGLEFHF